MKKILFILIVQISAIGYAFAQCNEFYQLNAGSEWETQTYSDKDKPTGKVRQKITDYKEEGAGFKATIHSITYNEKGKEMTQGDLNLSCDKGTVLIDMRGLVNDDYLKAFKDVQMKVETENLEIPSKLTAGQTLKNGKATITTVGDSALPMELQVDITERKVEGKESITTPAGTFECYKITGKSTTHLKMVVNTTFQFNTVEWLAPKVGVVKTESYNAKNGKRVGYSLLTYFK